MFKSALFSILCAACAFAQTDGGPGKNLAVQLNDPGDLAIVKAKGDLDQFVQKPFFFSLGASKPVPGAPYSAESTTQRVQMLYDGNRIEQTESANVARDSQGRVRTESVISGMALPGGDAPHLISIDDPVAGVRYTLDATNKIAFKMPSKMPGFSQKPDGDSVFISSGGAPGQERGQVILTAGASVMPNVNETKTDLGTQTIEGVQAKGTRLTRTIPAGSIGNQAPIVITTETWYSPDLKVLVMSKSSDPRIGETTYTLTNIQRSEPSPTLFQVPADYTIKDEPGKLQSFKVSTAKQ